MGKSFARRSARAGTGIDENHTLYIFRGRAAPSEQERYEAMKGYSSMRPLTKVEHSCKLVAILSPRDFIIISIRSDT